MNRDIYIKESIKLRQEAYWEIGSIESVEKMEGSRLGFKAIPLSESQLNLQFILLCVHVTWEIIKKTKEYVFV